MNRKIRLTVQTLIAELTVYLIPGTVNPTAEFLKEREDALNAALKLCPQDHMLRFNLSSVRTQIWFAQTRLTLNGDVRDCLKNAIEAAQDCLPWCDTVLALSNPNYKQRQAFEKRLERRGVTRGRAFYKACRIFGGRGQNSGHMVRKYNVVEHFRAWQNATDDERGKFYYTPQILIQDRMRV